MTLNPVLDDSWRTPGPAFRKAVSRIGGASSFVLVLSTMVANVTNFLFHVAVGRLLTPASYGALVSLLGAVLVLSVPLNALQIAVARDALDPDAAGDPHGALRPLIARSILVSGAVYACIALLSPLFAGYLHLGSWLAIALVASYLVPAVASVGPRGVLLAQRRFAAVGGSIVIGATCRLAMGWMLVQAGLGLTGALSATVLSEVAMFGALTYFTRSQVISSHAPSVRLTWRGSVASIAAFGGYWLFVGIDAVLARHFLSANASGAYGAAATAGRSVLFLSSAVALLVFPTFVEGRGDRSAVRALARSLVAVVAVGLVATAVIALLPRLTIHALFGDRYPIAVHVVGLTSLAAVSFAAIGVCVHFHLARRSWSALVPWAGVVAAICAVRLNRGSPAAVATTMVVVSSAVACAMVVAAFLQTAFAPRPDGGARAHRDT